MAGALVAVILVLVMVGLLASYLLTRVESNTGDRERTQQHLARAAEALDAFAATAYRLPCPANPALDAGDEVLPAVGAATCSFPEGTLPWRTIGMKRDESFDAWSRKIAYRVYTGGNGSLTQPGGASMAQCDTIDPSPGARTAVVGSAGGLCIANADVYQLSTSTNSFLAGKQLALTADGTPFTNVGYVLVSHGATGLGGYTASGIQLDLPVSSAERDNIRAAGPFTIKAFSGSDVAATMGQHFDDLLVFRTIPDLVRRAGLDARDWPDTWALFSEDAIERAIGRQLTPGQGIGETSFQLPGMTVSGINAGGTAQEIGFDVIDSVAGIGVSLGTSMHLESNFDERIRITLGKVAETFAITLNHFGAYFTGSPDPPYVELYFEQVVFAFYEGEALKKTEIKRACQLDGGLASFSFPVGATFDRVDIVAVPAVNAFPPPPDGISTFLVSEVRGCNASEPSCKTTLSATANECP